MMEIARVFNRANRLKASRRVRLAQTPFFKVYAAILVALCALPSVPVARPASAQTAPVRKMGCGFNPLGAEDEWHTHKLNARKLGEREADAVALEWSSLYGGARVEDSDNISVIEDDGRVVIPPNKFDLKNRSLLFTPDQGGYRISRADLSFASERGYKIGYFFGAGSAGTGHLVEDADDGYKDVELQGAQFPFFGAYYDRIFIGTNGYISFNGGDTSARTSAASLASQLPRIAPLWADLAVSGGGNVYYNRTGDHHVITWDSVPQSGSKGANTFQAVLYDDGRIAFVYKKIKVSSALVGLSPGGSSEDAVALDLSAPPDAIIEGPLFESFSKQKRLDVPAVTRSFYRAHADEFDAVFVWTDFAFDNGLGVAHSFNVRNDINGIGLRLFDSGGIYGSTSRLSTVVVMGNATADWPADPQAHVVGLNSAISIVCHEQGHRWLAYVLFDAEHDIKDDLLGRQMAHWSFLLDTRTNAEGSFSSLMEGNAWRDNNNGTFSTTESSVNYFSDLDQYLMGLRSKDEVGSISYLVVDDELKALLRSRSPVSSFSLSAGRKATSVDQIIEREGPRVPASADAPKNFRFAFLLVTQQDEASKSLVDQLDRYRTALERYFSVATGRRGSLDGLLEGTRMD